MDKLFDNVGTVHREINHSSLSFLGELLAFNLRIILDDLRVDMNFDIRSEEREGS